MTEETQQPIPASEASKLLYETQEKLDALSGQLMEKLSSSTDAIATSVVSTGGGDNFFVMGLTIFVLACFVGYYVVWKVTPALHSPLMGITNAISSVIIVGAILAAGPTDGGLAKFLGFLGITLASVNIFGGFIITRRMLSMFKKKGE
jgi:NAD(P) transhydrogenase subunit alpha